MNYEIVIGLEVHAQLLTATKIFCGCSSKFGAEPNTLGCPVCLGLPGSLPVLNRKAVDMAILTGLAVDCQIASKSIFARKNYFYPDLPKGYQISQYDMPLCSNGSLTINVDNKEKKIGITRIHLEEDAGKLVHDQDESTLFDVNRCGTPLMEIVSEPDLRSSREAYAYLTGLKRILEYLNVCDCNMEEGSLRCDANISLRPFGRQKFGTKTELKNMNSFHNVEKALEYEVFRQKEILDAGGTIEQQTYLWDADTGQTHPMRSKEDAHDYRYFPEPDLLPLIISNEKIAAIKARIIELPVPRRDRFMAQYRLSAEHADVLTSSRQVADYFEAAVANGGDPKAAANWIMVDILRIAKEKKCDIDRLRVTPHHLSALLTCIAKGTISASAGKTVLDKMEETGKQPEPLIAELGLAQISDSGALEKIIREIVDKNPGEVARLKAGDQKLQAFFVGQVMKATRGKGNPKEINRLLSEIVGT